MKPGIVFDIKRFSIHDGPGIRTTVFLKGCPLTCLWCHNPESQQSALELIFRPERCIHCGACFEACPEGAIYQRDGSYLTNRSLCKVCGICVDVCCAEAREIIGKELSTEEILKEVLKDKPFYDQSNGGLTFSGGEPLQQLEFLEELLRESKANNLHTALDTCGYAPWDDFLRILPYLDLVLYDVKIMDDQLHKKFTGVSNRQVLDNLTSLAEYGTDLNIRFPVLPGLNDTEDQIRKLGETLKELNGISKVDLLPYHELSSEKYRRLDRSFNHNKWRKPSRDEMIRIQSHLSEFELEVSIRG